MIYIYDVLLNFNNDLYEFYEWEKSDSIYHIKKIPIFKVNTNIIDTICCKKITLKDDFLKLIFNKTEVYDNKKIKKLKYAAIFTDGYKAIGCLIENNTIIKLSDLLIDEAYDVINISNRCNLTDLEYNIIGYRKNNYFLTRQELKIKKYLQDEIKKIYKNKNNYELEYLHFEYFNTNETNIELIYQKLMDSLKEINHKHFKLYDLLKLCNKSTSNLTN